MIRCIRCGESVPYVYVETDACWWCDPIVAALRPTPVPSVSRMETNMRYLKYAIVGALCALILLLAFTCSNAEAKPRPPVPAGTPVACIHLWEKAPNGQKWKALKKCLDRYCAKPRVTPVSVTVKHVSIRRTATRDRWSAKSQRKVIAWIVNEGRARKLPVVFIVSAIATTTQESSAREINHGHGTSIGPFQLIDEHVPEGQPDRRRTIEFSGNWFYNGAKKVYRPGMDPVTLSHRVQRSAHPTAVARWMTEARRTLKLVMGPCYYTLNR